MTAVVVLAVTALPAFTVNQAAQAAPAPAAGGNENSQGRPAVTDAAWAAGRATFGRQASASQAVEAYWTPERMRAARPVEESPAYLAAMRKADETAAAAKARGTASGGSGQAAPAATPHSVAPARGVQSETSRTTAAFNPNLSPGQPTAATSGKVFFSMAGGNFVCSGTIVNSEGADTVWTAGHCVHGGQGGQWASNWQFVPAYDDDLATVRPFGTWTAGQLWTRTAWINGSDTAEDMGVAIMNMNFGFHIVNYLGGQGIATGQGRNVAENAFGYPAEAPFDGGNLWGCSGGSSAEWSFLFFWSETLKISCNMTRGSSGGGWLLGWDGNWGWLNGVNSRIDRIVNPTIMLSPYFDDTAWSLFNDTRNL